GKYNILPASRPVDGNSFNAEFIGHEERFLAVLLCSRAGHVDGFTDRGVDMFLKTCLHPYVITPWDIERCLEEDTELRRKQVQVLDGPGLVDMRNHFFSFLFPGIPGVPHGGKGIQERVTEYRIHNDKDFSHRVFSRIGEREDRLDAA